jgi:hypothetical protein
MPHCCESLRKNKVHMIQASINPLSIRFTVGLAHAIDLGERYINDQTLILMRNELVAKKAYRAEL